MSSKIKWLFLCSFFFCLTIVSTFSAAHAAQSTADAVVDATAKAELRKQIVGDQTFPGEDKEYVIGYGDILSISIYGEGNMAAAPAPELRRESVGPAAAGNAGAGNSANAAGGVIVRSDGRVSLMHVGEVDVVGMTLTQVADYLKKLYASIYSDPVVTAVLIQSNSRRYTVMGQVTNPGVYQLDYPITVIQTIARCGGFTEWAKHDITVVRAGDGLKTQAGEPGKNTIKVDYDDIVKGKDLDKNVHIQSGDLVIVH